MTRGEEVCYILHQVAGEGFCDKGALKAKPAGNEGSLT